MTATPLRRISQVAPALACAICLASCGEDPNVIVHDPSDLPGGSRPLKDPSEYQTYDSDQPMSGNHPAALLVRGRANRNRASLIEWSTAARKHRATDGEGFPPSLGSIESGGHLTSSPVEISWENPANADRYTPLYFPDASVDEPKSVLFAGALPNPDSTRDVVYSDGTLEVIPEADFQATGGEAGATGGTPTARPEEIRPPGLPAEAPRLPEGLGEAQPRSPDSSQEAAAGRSLRDLGIGDKLRLLSPQTGIHCVDTLSGHQTPRGLRPIPTR